MNILERVSDRLASSYGHRTDLRIAEARKSSPNDNRVDVLVRFARSMGIPSVADVSKYVSSRFEGKLIIGEMATFPAVGRGDNGAVSVQATFPVETQDYELAVADPASWKPVSAHGDRFMEVRTAKVWNVKRDHSGNPVMFRAEEEDLDRLLAAVRTDRTAAAGSLAGVTFAALAIEAGANLYDLGDTVEYHCRGTRCVGIVTAVDRARVEPLYHVLGEDGSNDLVPAKHMLAVRSKGEASKDQDRTDLVPFFERTFGSREFARKMTGQR